MSNRTRKTIETAAEAATRALAEIHELLRDVGDSVDDYAGNAAHSPASVTWGDAANLGKIREDLRNIATFLGLRDETSACSVCREETTKRVDGEALCPDCAATSASPRA